MPSLRLPPRRPGPLGAALLLPLWVVLGLAVVVYVVGLMVLAFVAVLVATLRLLLAAPAALLGRRPGSARVASGG